MFEARKHTPVEVPPRRPFPKDGRVFAFKRNTTPLEFAALTVTAIVFGLTWGTIFYLASQ